MLLGTTETRPSEQTLELKKDTKQTRKRDVDLSCIEVCARSVPCCGFG
jgi:hypothetical protein